MSNSTWVMTARYPLISVTSAAGVVDPVVRLPIRAGRQRGLNCIHRMLVARKDFRRENHTGSRRTLAAWETQDSSDESTIIQP